MPGVDVSHYASRAIRGRAKAKLELIVRPDLFAYIAHKGALLDYLAEAVINQINLRTNQSLDHNRKRFKPYKKVYAWKLQDPDKVTTNRAEFFGNVIRRDDGKWDADIIRGPNEPVTLRSIKKADDDKRMRAWLRQRPDRLLYRRDVDSVLIVQKGGRKAPDGTHLGHYKRALTCVQTGRKHIGLNLLDWAKLLNGIRKSHVLAFIEKRKEQFKEIRKRKADRLAKRTLRSIKRQTANSDRVARNRHRAFQKMRERYGIPPEVGAKEAWKSIARKKRERAKEKERARIARSRQKASERRVAKFRKAWGLD